MSKSVMSHWYKSSYSDDGNQCVEVRHEVAATLVRDTKDLGSGPILSFPADTWTAFLTSDIWH